MRNKWSKNLRNNGYKEQAMDGVFVKILRVMSYKYLRKSPQSPSENRIGKENKIGKIDRLVKAGKAFRHFLRIRRRAIGMDCALTQWV